MNDSRLNVFQAFEIAKNTPFAVSRRNWSDSDFAVIIKVEPIGKYGKAFGYPVRDMVPNDHFMYSTEWRKNLEIPNAGSYQWRIIQIDAEKIDRLSQIFVDEVAVKYNLPLSNDMFTYLK